MKRPQVSSLVLVLLISSALACTTHQRPAAQNGWERAMRATGPAGSTGAGAAAAAPASQKQIASASGPGPIVMRAVAFAETDPVRSLRGSAAEADPTQSQPGIEINELNSAEGRPIPDSVAGMVRPDATLKTTTAARTVNAMPSPSINFEGNSAANNTAVFGGTVAPPDTNGAVGPNHYVQMTNLLTGIYDKATGALVTPPGRFALSPLFAKLGGVCATTNDGDPVVQYDKLADRWVLSQFGFIATNTPPYHQCIAVSKTADPTGAYYAYDFVLPGQEFPDYPKLGTWPDAYYMTTNQFFLGGSFDGGGAFALDRSKMLVGDPTATGLYFNLCFTAGHCTPNHPEGIFGMLPSDFDGLTPPPAGAKNIFTYPLSVSFGDAVDGARLFEFTPDFATPGNSTFLERADSPALLAAYDGRDPGGRGDVREPTPGENLESLASRFMHRLQYQNRGGIETWVSNITVNVGTGAVNATNYRAAPRYFELSRTSPGGVITTTEQATFAPNPNTDNVGRWMGSAAEDASGNLAVGYSITAREGGTGPAIFPSINWAGRLVTDPPGGLFQGEATMFAGLGTQTGTSNRWGDYSAMQIDPVDYCTFWFTSEYYGAGNTSFNWRTRIGAFKFPSCVSPAMGRLTGTVTYCADGTPIAGALITVSDGHGSATIADGTYSINLPPGTYTVSASAPALNCVGSSPQTVTITNGETTTADFCLTGTPLIDLVADSFDDSSGNNNGIINRDECFKVNTVLKNDGCFPDTGLTAVLSTSTAGVVVDQPFSAYPDLAINASGANITPYQAHTTPGFVCGTPIVFTLTEHSNLGGTRVFHFSFPTCGGGAAQPFSGTLVAGDQLAVSRLGRNAVASVCGTAKGCPGAFDANQRRYDTFSFHNPAAVSVCLTVTLHQANCANALLAAGYLDNFDGTNLCLHYLGDAGGSANTSSFAVDVPGGHDLVLSIQQTTVGLFCPAGYDGTVTGFLDDSSGGGACPTAVCATCDSPVQADPYPITNCSGGDVKAAGATVINLPAKDVVLQCALAELPGTNGIKINAHSIKVDGPNGGSITTNGKTGTQLTAATTIDLESTSVLDNNPNGGLKMTAGGDIVANNSTVRVANSATLDATSTGGKVCSRGNTVGGNVVSLTGSGDVTLVGTSVQVTNARSGIKLTSSNGSVLASGLAGCPPNSFTSAGNDGNMTVTANGVAFLGGACVDVAENVTVTAAGAGKDCSGDIIIDLTDAVVRNDFGKPGFITMTACGGNGLIETNNAILADAGANGGGTDPNAVSNLNGGKKTDPLAPPCLETPACGGPVNQPVSADQADRHLHHVVGVPRCDS